MRKSLEFVPLAILVFFTYGACLFNSSEALGEKCGSTAGIQLYCPSQYHCCDTETQSCCGNGYVCSGTICINIVAIVIPCVIVVGILVAIIITVICVIKNKKIRKGKVIRPAPPSPKDSQPAGSGSTSKGPVPSSADPQAAGSSSTGNAPAFPPSYEDAMKEKATASSSVSDQKPK